MQRGSGDRSSGKGSIIPPEGLAGRHSALPASLPPAGNSLSLASRSLSGHRPPLVPFESWIVGITVSFHKEGMIGGGSNR